MESFNWFSCEEAWGELLPIPRLFTVKKSPSWLGLIQLGLTAVASATHVIILKKMLESGATALIFSNEEMNGIMKIIESFE